MPYIPAKYATVVPKFVSSGVVERAKIVVVGAGPIGLAMALDLSLQGMDVLVLDRSSQLSDGSRAICYAKRPLEIMDRLGFAEKMVEKGVNWHVGRVFFKDDPDPIYSFDLLPLKDQKQPAMINIQQYYNEEFTIEALAERDNVEIRWGNQVVGIDEGSEHVTVDVETDGGTYQIKADWLIACDGAHSPIRTMMGRTFEGETFQDNFLIADVKFKKKHPSERHFWFDPSFNPGQSVLLHKQPDDVWRIDFQVGWDIDRDEIVKPENVTPRIKAMLGDDIEFDYEWISVYTFNCRRIDRMATDRVMFAGDAAHLVSPFGARGANTGFQDTDNLAWKLKLVDSGLASTALLESYNSERLLAADINILNSTRSTDFITPKSKVSGIFRDSVLELSREYPFARLFINSGRLSTPVPYPHSTLNTRDCDQWDGGVAPGTNAIDAPISHKGQNAWLLDQLGWGFRGLYFVGPEGLNDKVRQELIELAKAAVPIATLLVVPTGAEEDSTLPTLVDCKGLVQARYNTAEGDYYLFRPDQYVAARWQKFVPGNVSNALMRAIGKSGEIA